MFPHYETIPDLSHQYATISDLPHSYENIPETTPHHYNYISNDIYSKGEPEGLAKYKWYHGKITRDQADAALSLGNSNKFFVWHDSNKLILTKRIFDMVSHTTIHHSPKGYQLERDSKLFDTISEMIAHYQESLGTAVKTVPTGNTHTRRHTENIPSYALSQVRNWRLEILPDVHLRR